MRTPSEKSIVEAIKRYLDSVGAWHVKTHGGTVGRVGIPDLLVCYRGLFIALEVKKPKVGKVSVVQRVEIEKIRKAGGEAHVVTSVAEVEAIIAVIDRVTNLVLPKGKQ